MGAAGGPCAAGGQRFRRTRRGAAAPAATAAWTALVAVLLLAAPPMCQAEVPSGYSCVCSEGQPDCVCPSISPPGGLDPERTPQFILFAHDDGIKDVTYEAMRAVTDGRQSLNGCPAVATMFTTSALTECDYLKQLYDAGYEIADHTEDHISVLDLEQAQLEEQIVESRANLAACGIPESDVVGFRAPFLQMDSKARAVAHQAGYLYDSSIVEMAGLETYASSLSYGPKKRVWPFTMQDGVPISCQPTEPYASCDISERYQGMWEVPVWDLHAVGAYTMDYGADGKHKVHDILKKNFDAAYKGNRAPMPLFIHTPWLEKHVEAVQSFAEYALSKPDVYFVTVRQLLAWMNNPIPADQLTPEALGCGSPGGAPGTAASSSIEAAEGEAAAAALDTEGAEQEGSGDEQVAAGDVVEEEVAQNEEAILDVDSGSATTETEEETAEAAGVIFTYSDTSAGSPSGAPAPGGAPAPEGPPGPAAPPILAPQLQPSEEDAELDMGLAGLMGRKLAATAGGASSSGSNADGRGVSTAAVVALAVVGAAAAAGIACWVVVRRRRAAQAQAQMLSRLLEASEP